MYAEYDEDDPIFDLSEEISKDEQEKISSNCKICDKPQPKKEKMKNW